MINTAFARLLSQTADLLELNKDNPFRIRAFRRAAQVVEGLSEDLGDLTRDQRLAIPGIGKGIADMIEEFQAKGGVEETERLKKKFPPGVLDMMNLGGLGPKRAARLFRELRIDTIPKLAMAAQKGALKKLEGFGEKLEQNILKSIQFQESGGGRVLLGHARLVATSLKKYLSSAPFISHLELAGSARRWRETIGDLDFVCVSKNLENAIDHFLKFPGVARKLGAGGTKASVVLAQGLQVDFRVVTEESFGAALLYFTGSKEHNVRLRELAQKKGWSLNEYGLFNVSDLKKTKPLAGKTEEEIYNKLGLDWIPPELREDRGEIEAAREKKLPRLVEAKDVRGDFHNHTKLSDGANSLEEMVETARALGWKWFFSADHSPSLKIASGLPVPVLKKKMSDVRKLDEKSKDMRIFISSEVDILADGALDYPDDVLDQLDCVVGSVHSRFNQPEDQMTERICRAIRNPSLDILGHLTGRLINKRPGYAVNIETVLQTAQQTQTAIEINGQPDRAELSDVHVKRAVDLGVPLALNTDAHSTEELDHMDLALHVARRGWAEPRHLLNCLSSKDIIQWLKK